MGSEEYYLLVIKITIPNGNLFFSSRIFPRREGFRDTVVMIDWRDRARARMKASGITQERLAQNFSMSPAAIQKWLAGDRQPTFEQINQIAQALNVSPPWLTYGLDSNSVIVGLPEVPAKVLRDLLRLEREGKLRPEHWGAMAALVVAFTPEEGIADGCCGYSG